LRGSNQVERRETMAPGLQGLFKFRELHAATGARGEIVPAEERQLLEQDFFRTSQMHSGYEADGWLDVGFRSSIVRIASAKLGIAAVVALATATAAPTTKLAAGCGISGGVCVVAFAYYRLITHVREQQAPRGYAKLALRWLAKGAAAPEDGASVGQRTFAQELQVDGLRFSDWVTTVRAPRPHVATRTHGHRRVRSLYL